MNPQIEQIVKEFKEKFPLLRLYPVDGLNDYERFCDDDVEKFIIEKFQQLSDAKDKEMAEKMDNARQEGWEAATFACEKKLAEARREEKEKVEEIIRNEMSDWDVDERMAKIALQNVLIEIKQLSVQPDDLNK